MTKLADKFRAAGLMDSRDVRKARDAAVTEALTAFDTADRANARERIASLSERLRDVR